MNYGERQEGKLETDEEDIGVVKEKDSGKLD